MAITKMEIQQAIDELEQARADYMVIYSAKLAVLMEQKEKYPEERMEIKELPAAMEQAATSATALIEAGKLQPEIL